MTFSHCGLDSSKPSHSNTGEHQSKPLRVDRDDIPLAIVYDFDGTLAPGNMQETQFIPEIGMKPEAFWKEVKSLSKEHQADEILMYMHLMISKAYAEGKKIKRKNFQELGKNLELFPGVDGWFDRVNRFGDDFGVKVEHYIVSSGNAEIIEGTSIAKQNNFRAIYASRFFYEQHGVASWPAQAVNTTTKTQFLFRINKGVHDLSSVDDLNRFVPKEKRRIPFGNMVYIGDGNGDIPCFRLVKDQGGFSLAVFSDCHANADQLYQDGRIHGMVQANYTEDSKLYKLVRMIIKHVATRDRLTGMLLATTTENEVSDLTPLPK